MQKLLQFWSQTLQIEHRADGLLGVVSRCLPLAWTLLVCPANKIFVMNETMQSRKALQLWYSNVVEISKISSNSNGIDELAKPSVTARKIKFISSHAMLLQRNQSAPLALYAVSDNAFERHCVCPSRQKNITVRKVPLYSHDSLEWTTHPRIILIALPLRTYTASNKITSIQKMMFGITNARRSMMRFAEAYLQWGRSPKRKARLAPWIANFHSHSIPNSAIKLQRNSALRNFDNRNWVSA